MTREINRQEPECSEGVNYRGSPVLLQDYLTDRIEEGRAFLISRPQLLVPKVQL